MKSINELLPIASVLLIYLARMVEVGTKRETVPGPVRERLTLRLFIAAGTLMVAGAILESFVNRRSLNVWTFGGGWVCARLLRPTVTSARRTSNVTTESFM